MGLDSTFFNWLQFYLADAFRIMDSTTIFDAYGFQVSLWDLYTTSTTLIAFFDSVIFPLLALWGVSGEDEESVIDFRGSDKDD